MADPDLSIDASLPRLTIGVCTKARPRGLHRLWRSLVAMRVPDDLGAVELVVVDNSSAGDARSLVGGFGAASPWPVRYVHEPRPGIPAARNALLSAAGDGLAMVDDDQTVDPGWLHALWARHRQLGAAVVTGPALPRFEAPPPAWIVQGGFFEPRRFATGNLRPTAFTSNVLIVMDVVRAAGVRFDEERRLGGGSDELFFQQLRRAGAAIVWADDAVTYEWVPESRASVGWLVRRTFRTGLAHAANARALGQARNEPLTTGARHVGHALPRLPWWWLTRPEAERVALLRDLAWGVGLLAGSLGVRYPEYRRVHGS